MDDSDLDQILRDAFGENHPDAKWEPSVTEAFSRFRTGTSHSEAAQPRLRHPIAPGPASERHFPSAGGRGALWPVVAAVAIVIILVVGIWDGLSRALLNQASSLPDIASPVINSTDNAESLTPTPTLAKPTVRLAMGAAGPVGYRYAISLADFAPGRSVDVTCYDSQSPNGFYSFSIETDHRGSGETSSGCYSQDGPDHWVLAQDIESNHVLWGEGGIGSAGSVQVGGDKASTYSQGARFRPETTGGLASTWSNPANAGGQQGPGIPNGTTVEIACKVAGFAVSNGNTWWYRIQSAPWNGLYYASADAFYNNGATTGPLKGTPFVDPLVPGC